MVGTRPGAVPPVSLLRVAAGGGGVGAGFQQAGLQAANALTSQADSQATAAYLRLFLVGGLGLVAIAISVALGLWIGRRLVRELSSLRETARWNWPTSGCPTWSGWRRARKWTPPAQAPPITAPPR